jgi:hypothetical protein
MSFNEIITFGGGINTDDTPQGMPKGDYRDFSYCRLGYNSGNAYAVETSDGTLVIPVDGPNQIEIQDQILGATQWLKENSIIYFVFKADLNHQIWVYSITNQEHTLVLESSELNFSRDWPIFHANVIDDILKWTDGRWDPEMYDADGNRLFNPPYQINLRKALDGDYPAITLQTIDAVKWPLEPPLVSYFTSATKNDNKLRNKLFKFIIQPIYENDEPGVWSMYSNLDLPQQSELVSGTNWISPNNSNGIRIQFKTGPSIIRKFNIAVQQFDKDSFGVVPPFAIFLQLDKDQDSIPDNTIYSVDYYGGVSTVPATDVFKNYDRLPIVADCQEYLPTNQLAYVNFREGYDKPTEEPFILDVQVNYQLNEISWNPQNPLNFLRVQWTGVGTFELSNKSFASAPDPSYTFNPFAVFPFSSGTTFSFTAPDGEFISYTLTDSNIQTALSQPSIIEQNEYIFTVLGNSFASQMGDPFGFVTSNSTLLEIAYNAPTTTPPTANRAVFVWTPTSATPSLKCGATHEFGIVYGDRAYRDSTVYTANSMNLFVPWFYDTNRSSFIYSSEDPFTVNPRFTIDHIPPVWATKYWIVAKPATEILSFGQYTTNSNPVQPAGGYYTSSVSVDDATNNRYKIELDRFYEAQNIGASIQHEIKVGDKVRFIRKRPGGNTANDVPYLPYLELDVLDVKNDGVNGRKVIYTNLFDTTLIDDSTSSVGGFLFGQLLEVYTPRPSIDDNGNIFISTWKDITEAIVIKDPHTENRAHCAPPLFYVQVSSSNPYFFYIGGDYSSLDDNFDDYSITVYNTDGTTSTATVEIDSAVYNKTTNLTVLTLEQASGGASFPATAGMAYVTFNTNLSAPSGTTSQCQIVSSLNSTQPATFSLGYGDVYVRRREYQTGLVGSGAVSYYFIEDPHYSDYWSSKVYNDGRIRIEDPNARMTHRQAAAIHSDSFIVGTQINGLSSFALDNQNIEDMNPTFGPIIKALMSGREGKTLKCLQAKKENSIYIQYYPNEVGSDSTVRVSNKTFASWFDYKSLLGCTNPGATAILPNGATIYFDNNAGVFVYSGGNGQTVISEIDQDSGKDYKFRTKTKALAAAYNASSNPMVRTYVNESVGEVGFAFRFDAPFFGSISSIYNPPFELDRSWILPTDPLNPLDYSFLYDQEIVIVLENGNVYSGVVDSIRVDGLGNSIITVDGVNQDPADYDVPGYFYVLSDLAYDHVVFDYVNMRWRSTYDYNFQQFCNLGQTLVGWGANNQMYLHNQPNQWTFHGDSFVQKVSFVSNENPLMLKRYQDITLISDDLFSITAESEPNRSYPRGMKTTMPTNLISTYEGYGKVNYRKNLYDPKFLVDANVSVTIYDPPASPINGWALNGDQTGLVGETITIIQDDGNIYTGVVATGATYDSPANRTTINLIGLSPGTVAIDGTWYMSERAFCNGQDIRANALTHTLEYDPTINNTPSILFSVGIKGVLS